ncbi:CaiB/BaiF CoA transferase family protein [Peristeroidobacter soli]|uniref:CaiB/BaiF CoA transferase family protein n=1 Tax=Peristeroidobacter soli TaxID=2497877 RepID=UPI001C377F67|nr:CaiB/BaiF CoA-transferase family protein [Peristeroidobacter soli]
MDLDGLTVVSVEQAVAAPFASGLLAQAGARVLKVERPEGDFARKYDSDVAGLSAYFVWLNAGKESICLDLREDRGRKLLSALVDAADVFIQNLKPGALARLGFDSAALRASHPQLITCDITGFGTSGPCADLKAYDLVVQGEVGLCSITGSAEPARVGISICDIAAGVTAHAAILQALFARTRSKRGRGIQVSLFDSLAQWMSVPLLQYLYGGRTPPRVGVAHPTIAPYGVFDCADGSKLILSVQNDREWSTFATDFLQRAELGTDLRFRDNTARVANRPVVDAIVAETCARLSYAEASLRLGQLDIAHGRLNSLAEATAHPHLRTVSVETPNGSVRIVAPPAIFSDSAPRVTPKVPACGEHTHAIEQEFGRARQQSSAS